MKNALLYSKIENKKVKCHLCSHYCEIEDGSSGICKTRINQDGELFTLNYDNATNYAIDPIEKKPFYNFKPGSRILSFGSPGCNFQCSNCQNWNLSQTYKIETSRDLRKGISVNEFIEIMRTYSFDGVAFTYSEPTIFFEYARDIIQLWRQENDEMDFLFVSNGYLSNELIDMIAKEKLIDAINIDLKFFSDDSYKRICKASLSPVINTIKRIYELRDEIHLELINLLIPEENDRDDQIKELCDFIAETGKDIPLHFSRFFPSHQMRQKRPTDNTTLLNAQEIAENAGLEYIYLGNVDLSYASDTKCPNCKKVLIRRRRYSVNFIDGIEVINGQSYCTKCNHKLNIKL